LKLLYSNEQTRRLIVQSILNADGKKVGWQTGGYTVIWNGSIISSVGRNSNVDFSQFLDFLVVGTSGFAQTQSVNSTDYSDDAQYAAQITGR
jgi:hypothetical protein